MFPQVQRSLKDLSRAIVEALEGKIHDSHCTRKFDLYFYSIGEKDW